MRGRCRAWGFHPGHEGQQPPPRKATQAPQWVWRWWRGLRSPHSPPGHPFFKQMVLILQEVEQGANLSLIFKARPLISYLFI